MDMQVAEVTCRRSEWDSSLTTAHWHVCSGPTTWVHCDTSVLCCMQSHKSDQQQHSSLRMAWQLQCKTTTWHITERHRQTAGGEQLLGKVTPSVSAFYQCHTVTLLVPPRLFDNVSQTSSHRWRNRFFRNFSLLVKSCAQIHTSTYLEIIQ